MSFTFKRTQEAAASSYCIFGKLPRRADFIRINATHPAAAQLDHLLADSISLLSPATEAVARYRAMPPSCFVLRSRDQDWLSLGVIQPSHDESGRNYPLVAVTQLPASLALPPLAVLLLTCELFFSGLKDQLASAIDNAVEMVACRQFLEAQALFGVASNDDVALAEQLLSRHLTITPAHQLERLLARQPGHTLETTLLAFIFHSQLQHRFRDSLCAQTYLLPLPATDGEDMLAAATWLSLYQAAASSHGADDAQCLLINRPDGRFLALQPRSPDAHIVAQCWGEPLDERFVVDIGDEQAPWRRHQSYAEASYILGRRLNDPGLSVAQLRDLVASLARSIA
ncbi:type VI secretion system-associated protein TagF [Pseudogulbenkiania subflava]|uniref:Type VI secretion system protein ImpM n=1 Tax=Pseudogulbenkiania subflava DSM 22618 TaxID=1123014 RepID=A0A1Y6BQD5_9NEIS|nr:type VI secretion system-associated protein TagF [Pseudogulbenkiania subflava]SMF12994.1 type VI secretion system protein ImpM [Pseudogulbenkiania subflava DSM 22618]